MKDDFLKILVSLYDKTKTNISKLEKLVVEVKPETEVANESSEPKKEDKNDK